MPRTKNKSNAMEFSELFLGIDNGVSGSIGVIPSHGTPILFQTPVFKEQSYTKKKARISRIDGVTLSDKIKELGPKKIRMCLLERPMVNPARFAASMSALRALEATLVILESFGIPYAYIDSKEWQSKLLPKGVKGSQDLKVASKDIACRLFPSCKEAIQKQKDGDGILIAEHCRRNYS